MTRLVYAQIDDVPRATLGRAAITAVNELRAAGYPARCRWDSGLNNYRLVTDAPDEVIDAVRCEVFTSYGIPFRCEQDAQDAAADDSRMVARLHRETYQ